MTADKWRESLHIRMMLETLPDGVFEPELLAFAVDYCHRM